MEEYKDFDAFEVDVATAAAGVYKDFDAFEVDATIAAVGTYNLEFDDCKKKVTDAFPSSSSIESSRRASQKRMKRRTRGKSLHKSLV